jgi:hypothetical protein
VAAHGRTAQGAAHTRRVKIGVLGGVGRPGHRTGRACVEEVDQCIMQDIAKAVTHVTGIVQAVDSCRYAYSVSATAVLCDSNRCTV